MDSDLPYWPSTLPTPQLGYRRQVNPRSKVSAMESRRGRVRRNHASSLVVLEVSWVFTQDQYAIFRTFFIETLEQGSSPFALVTLEMDPDPTLAREMTRQVAFFDGTYAFSVSDNCVAVDASLEVDAEEYVSIANPFYRAPVIPPVPPPPDLPVVYPTVCRELFTVTWTLPDDFEIGQDIIEAAETPIGPWYEYIIAIPDALQLLAQEITVQINNSFGGERWFRLTRDGVILKSPVKPLASVVQAPANLAIVNTAVSEYGLNGTGPFIRPVSYLENKFINPTAVYVEPTQRLEYSRNSNWDGIKTTVSLTAEAGATAKWTKDGSDPTIGMAWPPPKYEGVDYNARLYSTGWALKINARCFIIYLSWLNTQKG